jgi:hypothetical protein
MMMIAPKRIFLLTMACWVCFSVSTLAQTTPDYDSLVRSGRTQLQAGSADLALASSEAAIKINADRWEAYALDGGALMNLKRYEEAADKFSHAIDRAPEAKQSGLRDLRRQCVLAESGAPAPTDTAPPATTQAEIVLWKTIQNSTNPADFQSYLDQYPNGAFVGLAQSRMIEVKESGQKRILDRAKLDQESIWTDPATGLMWTKKDNGTDVSWNQAADFCRQMSLLSFSNWRVPTYGELNKVHEGSWKKHINGEFHLTDGAGSLWSSSPAGAGGYFSGKLSQSGYLIFPEPTKGNGMRTLCVRNP